MPVIFTGRVEGTRWQVVSSGLKGGVNVEVSAASTSYGRWLSSFDWSYWSTLTFKWSCPSPDAALRAFRRGWRAFERGPAKSPFCFVAVEEGRLYGRVHLHALISDRGAVIDPGLSSGIWLGLWWRENYGRAQVLGYEHDKGADYYIAKYVSKEVTSEWQVIGAFPRTL